MDATEHSRLLFLVDALQSAPNKSAQLLRMADKPGASQPYQNALGQLRAAAQIPGQLASASEELRRSLR